MNLLEKEQYFANIDKRNGEGVKDSVNCYLNINGKRYEQ